VQGTGPSLGPAAISGLEQALDALGFNDAVDQGIAGLAGAAIGGLIGVIGTLGAARLTGRDQRRNQHDHWRRQQQRDAYGQLVAQASEAIRAGGYSLDAYADQEPTAGDLAEQFHETVRRLDTAISLVALEGPEEAATSAMELVAKLTLWANSLLLVNGRDEGSYVPSTARVADMGLPELMEEKEQSHEALDSFIHLCRRLLDA
jgi:gas vesicle protein